MGNVNILPYCHLINLLIFMQTDMLLNNAFLLSNALMRSSHDLFVVKTG